MCVLMFCSNSFFISKMKKTAHVSHRSIRGFLADNASFLSRRTLKRFSGEQASFVAVPSFLCKPVKSFHAFAVNETPSAGKTTSAVACKSPPLRVKTRPIHASKHIGSAEARPLGGSKPSGRLSAAASSRWRWYRKSFVLWRTMKSLRGPALPLHSRGRG